MVKKKSPKTFAKEISKSSPKKRSEILKMLYKKGAQKKDREYVIKVLRLVSP